MHSATTHTSDQLLVLVDGSNVAFNGGRKATFANLSIVLEQLASFPVRVVTLADATLRHRIDRPDALEPLLSSGAIRQIPKGTSADDFLWQVALSERKLGHPSYVVTNDHFPEERAAAEGVTGIARVTFMVIEGRAFFQPTLEEILKIPSPGLPSLDSGRSEETDHSKTDRVTGPELVKSPLVDHGKPVVQSKHYSVTSVSSRGPSIANSVQVASANRGKDIAWELTLEAAKELWQKRRKSFPLEDGRQVAVKLDTLFGTVNTAIKRVRKNKVVTATQLTSKLFVQTLKDHGVVIESRAPPPHWTQTWNEQFCIFPSRLFDGSNVDTVTTTATVPSTTVHKPDSVRLKDQAEQLLSEGKGLMLNGKWAVRVSDFCPLYPPWNEFQMAQFLKLHGVATVRPWIPREKKRVLLWFPRD